MPKVLLYITTKITWIFLFFGFDFNENRAHVHVGKKATENYCKIWLEPEISIAKNGSLTSAELKQVVDITQQYHSQLLNQWENFKKGTSIEIITIKK
ncbi:MAG: DUF4160 domain-containing protein [Prevotellaceae bacterium]|jgi:hypothetical protein|nr:DUF4160 domain-containing protein [Prevotellaceae bacterium]